MTLDSTHFEDLQGRLRGLLIELEGHFKDEEATLLAELIDANECGVALEMLSELLKEARVPLRTGQVAEIVRLAREMDLPGVMSIAGETGRNDNLHGEMPGSREARTHEADKRSARSPRKDGKEH